MESGISQTPEKILFVFTHVDILIIQSIAHISLDEHIEDRCDGHRQKNPKYPIESSAHHDCSQHPEGRKADGIAHNLGVDEVSFDLLQHEEQKQKPQRLHRTVHEDQEESDGHGNKSTHNGDNGCNGHKDTHHHRVGEPEDQHGDHEHHAQNHSFCQLARDELLEDVTDKNGDAEKLVYSFLRQVGIKNPPDLSAQVLLV